MPRQHYRITTLKRFLCICSVLSVLALNPSYLLAAGEENQGEKQYEYQPTLRYLYTPERRNLPASQDTSSSSLLDKNDIKKKEQTVLFENLREVPSTNIYQSGTIGEEVNVSIRGTSANQTLILLEGIKLNSIFDQTFDLGSTLSHDMSTIEIIRGPQSSMYGSEAIGGVVNMFTQEADSKEIEFFFKGGNLRTFVEGASLKDATDSFNYNLGFTRVDSKGNGRRDAYHNNSFLGNAKIKSSDTSSIKLVTKYTNSHKSLPFDVTAVTTPEPALAFVEDQNRVFDSDLFFTTAIWNHSPLRLYDYTLQGGFVWENLELNNPPDDGSPNIEFSDIASYRTTFINQHNIQVLKQYSTSLGYEFTHDRISALLADTFPPAYEKDSVHPRITHGLYFQNYLNIGKNFRTKFGVRFDHISEFGYALSPRASLGYRLKEYKLDLRANYGEGFRAPTYRELFLPEIGNPELLEEKSRSFDVGLRHHITPAIAIDIAYFHNFLKNLINISENLIYENISTAQTYGAEAFVTITLAEIFTTKLTYTYTKALDTTTDPHTRLPFIPENRFNANFNVKPIERLNVNLNVHFITDQQNVVVSLPLLDSDGNVIGDKNPGFVKIDLAGSYTVLSNAGILKDLELNLVINNVLNRKIVELAGLQAAGINFLLGFKAAI